MSPTLAGEQTRWSAVARLNGKANMVVRIGEYDVSFYCLFVSGQIYLIFFAQTYKSRISIQTSTFIFAFVWTTTHRSWTQHCCISIKFLVFTTRGVSFCLRQQTTIVSWYESFPLYSIPEGRVWLSVVSQMFAYSLLNSSRSPTRCCKNSLEPKSIVWIALSL